ncbi:MAG: HD domain-containing protein [Ginsengibacter sp.]
MSFRKIINDPVYGFITIDDKVINEVISHPWYQRMRRIHQMAMAHLVYPGAVHTRLHHSLGAYHLMCNALHELKSKGIEILPEEEQGAKIAVLLHDIGHGPYSHALEHTLIVNHSHEEISLMMMNQMNHQMHGELDIAISIFTNSYPKKFLHQLVSGQLDVDRMDYLIRDSFFTGVSEGVIGYDRIIKMLTVHEGELMVEEKGIYSIEKFLVSRRFMYWQVYHHKTVLSAEKMLLKIMIRAKEINALAASPSLDFFLKEKYLEKGLINNLETFYELDDADVLFSIKKWASHPDKILALLCSSLIDRRLFKVKYLSQKNEGNMLQNIKTNLSKELKIDEEETSLLAFEGEVNNKTYDPQTEHIYILFKDGIVKDISQVDNPLINQSLFGTVKKFYICYLKRSKVEI